MGDGMLHGIRFSDGRAQTYANRWVRTTTFEKGRPVIGADRRVDLRASDVAYVMNAGRITTADTAIHLAAMERAYAKRISEILRIPVD